MLYITFTHIVVTRSICCCVHILSLVFSSKAPALLIRYSMFYSPYHHWCRRCINLNRQPITQTSNPHHCLFTSKVFFDDHRPLSFTQTSTFSTFPAFLLLHLLFFFAAALHKTSTFRLFMYTLLQYTSFGLFFFPYTSVLVAFEEEKRQGILWVKRCRFL